jgi:hypothetical protein
MRRTESGPYAERPVEKQFGKWTTEGEVKGLYLKPSIRDVSQR